MNRIIRFLAVIAIALSPVWGVQTVEAASGLAPAHYPVWPSFLSTGCNAIQGPSGSTTISCADASFLLTQINSGYACNQVDISVSTFNSGHFRATGTVNSGSQVNTVDITSDGNYYMQFPEFLTNNTVTIQIQAISAGSMSISSISGSPCAPITSTPTVNPSSTATNTPVPVTGTPTAIPTFTPLPSGHNTFTRTATPVPATNTPGAATATATPAPLTGACGQGFYDCMFENVVLVSGAVESFPWAYLSTHGGSMQDWWNNNGATDAAGYCGSGCGGYLTAAGYVQFHPIPADGQFCISITINTNLGSGNDYMGWVTGTNTVWTDANHVQNVNGLQSICSIVEPAGTLVGLAYGVNHNTASLFYLPTVTFNPVGAGTVVPGGTSTPTVTGTETNTPAPGTATSTATPTLTPIPIPGAMSTNIPTATECPGSCVVTQLTAIPGMSTRVTVDTSPFSPFTSLSLARSTCQPFGYVAIPYPVVHGTPAYGSTTPLSITWTTPITAPWDDMHPFSNTAVQPCAMLKEIPTLVWDFTYWFSVFSIAVVFIMWLIGFVGRLSGEETING